MLLKVALATVLLGIIFTQRSQAWFGFGDFHSEYRDVMTNCRMDGGTCFDPYAEARANAAEGESEGGAPKGGRRGRGGRGRPPPGARRPPPRVNIWQSLQENCGSWEFDFGCHRTGGYCCYPYP